MSSSSLETKMKYFTETTAQVNKLLYRSQRFISSTPVKAAIFKIFLLSYFDVFHF